MIQNWKENLQLEKGKTFKNESKDLFVYLKGFKLFI